MCGSPASSPRRPQAGEQNDRSPSTAEKTRANRVYKDACCERQQDVARPQKQQAVEVVEGPAEVVTSGLGMTKQILDGEDWRHKTKALRQLEEQLKAGRLPVPGPGELVEFTESIVTTLTALKDEKTEVPGGMRALQAAVSAIAALAHATQATFCTSAAAIIPELLRFLSTPKEIVQEAVAGSVEALLSECHAPAVLRAATVPLVGAKQAFLRRKGSTFLRMALESWPRAALKPTLPPVMSQIRKALFDTDATVRREGRHTFGVFIRLWPQEGRGMYHAVDRSNQRILLQEQPHVSNFVAATAYRGTSMSKMTTGNAIGGRLSSSGGGGSGGRGGYCDPGYGVASQRSSNATVGSDFEKENQRTRAEERQIRNLNAQSPPTDCGAHSSFATSKTGLESPAHLLPSSSASKKARSRARGLGLDSAACSAGLRRAAGLALKNHDLASPTLTRLPKSDVSPARGHQSQPDTPASAVAISGGRVCSSPACTSGRRRVLAVEPAAWPPILAVSPADLVRLTAGGTGPSPERVYTDSSCMDGDWEEVEHDEPTPGPHLQAGVSTVVGDSFPTRVLFADREDAAQSASFGGPRDVSERTPGHDVHTAAVREGTRTTACAGATPVAQALASIDAKEASAPSEDTANSQITANRVRLGRCDDCATSDSCQDADGGYLCSDDLHSPSRASKSGRIAAGEGREKAKEFGLTNKRPKRSCGRTLFGTGCMLIVVVYIAAAIHNSIGAGRTAPGVKIPNFGKAVVIAGQVVGFARDSLILRQRLPHLGELDPDLGGTVVSLEGGSKTYKNANEDASGHGDVRTGEETPLDKTLVPDAFSYAERVCVYELPAASAPAFHSARSPQLASAEDGGGDDMALDHADTPKGGTADSLVPLALGGETQVGYQSFVSEEDEQCVNSEGKGSCDSLYPAEAPGDHAEKQDPSKPVPSDVVDFSLQSVDAIPAATTFLVEPHVAAHANARLAGGDALATTYERTAEVSRMQDTLMSGEREDSPQNATSSWGWTEVCVALVGAVGVFVGVLRASLRATNDACPDDRDNIEASCRPSCEWEFQSPMREQPGLLLGPDCGARLSSGAGQQEHEAAATPISRGRTARGFDRDVDDEHGDDQLGTYTTIEMVKRGDTPATLRSVKRSRRISSAHKLPRSQVMVVDLGATSVDLKTKTQQK